MKNIIKFYLKQSSPFLLTVLGIYTVFNIINLIMGVIYAGAFHEHESAVLSTFITGIFMFIYLIKTNMYDTGKEKFTIVSMTEYSAEKILLSKLIVNFISILLFASIVAVFISLDFLLGRGNLDILFFPGVIIRVLFIYMVLASYISYPIIWTKSFEMKKKSRILGALGIIVIWFITNGLLRNSISLFYNNAGAYPRHFGHGAFTIWTILWHLMCCVIFFMITVHLQKKKIDLI